MSYGLFEHIAYTEQANRVEQRKALALARVRATHRFARFVQAGDTEERLALVAGDLQDTVKQACAEMDYPHWEHIHEAIVAHLGGTVHDAIRKPKMCPYHREVTDISLAAGDPASGFSAMAQHAWGTNHCQGEWEGKCNFKPEMTTQTWWDHKAEQAEERRQERERQQEQERGVDPATGKPFGDEDAGQGAQGAPPEEVEPIPAEAQGDSVFREENADIDTDVHSERALEPAMAASREAEALKTVDVTQGGETPIPKMDKSKWTPENVTFIDAEMPGSPHPTRQQDIKEPTDFEADIDEQTRAVTESQDVTQEGGVGRQPGQGGTFPRGDQAPPVTSASDPDKNPLKDDDEDEEED